jgi:transposase
MPRIALDVDYLVREYRAGRTADDLGRELGVSVNTIKSRLRKQGVSLAYLKPKPRIDIDVAALVEAYNDGASVKSLAERFGVSRGVIANRLKWQGITPRNRSEGMFLRMSQTSPEERARLAAAAHDAVRGRTVSRESKRLGAITRWKRLLGVSPAEMSLAQMLHDRGLRPEPQFPIGIYNCDLAIHPVAVEVWGGGFHFTGKHARRTPERIRQIMNAGWDVLCLVVDSRRYPLTPAVADYIVSHVEAARQNPSAIREYRVVWGAGEFSTGGCANDKYISFKHPNRHRRNSRTGQYESVPR